tara:strand:- start:1969 stop:2667 length:699 start_codon:yes stop_codon:yes gene_type:complete
MKELDFSQDIRAQLEKIEGSEEEITQEAWAAEKNSGKKLNKPFRTPGGPKKFSVYVKNEKGNVVKVNFGDPNMSIKRDDPARRKSFRARHGCDSPGPKTKAKYWSCKMWSKKSVTKVTKGESDHEDEMVEFLDESDSKLSDKQKKLPEAIKKAILKKKGESPKKDEKSKDSKDEKESDAKKGLWENIRDKKKREGKNYRPAKPGDKDYPDPKALKKAQESSKKKKEEKKKKK